MGEIISQALKGTPIISFCRYRSLWNKDLILRPFFLGGLFKLKGSQASFTIPAKELYLKKDWQINGVYFQVPLKSC